MAAMEPIEGVDPVGEPVDEFGTIDIEAEFTTFAEQVIGLTVFADLVLEMIQENEE